MSEEQVVTDNVITDSQGEPQRELRPEEQEAINRYRESQQTEEERGQGMPEGYNDDGTPQEELIAGKFKSQEDLLTAYQELEKKMSQKQPEPDQSETETTQETTEPAAEGSFNAPRS